MDEKKQDELRKEVIIMVMGLWSIILGFVVKVIEILVKAFY